MNAVNKVNYTDENYINGMCNSHTGTWAWHHHRHHRIEMIYQTNVSDKEGA